MAAALALALAQATVSAQPAYEPISYDEAARRLAECGFSNVEITYDDEIQSDIASISDTSMSDEQLDCLALALDQTGYWADIPVKYRPRYDEALRALSVPRMRERARVWFEERGMLAEVQAIPAEALGDEALGEAVETLCGASAQGALTTRYGLLTLDPDWMSPVLQEEGSIEALECLMTALGFFGREFGFIGNERLPPGN